MSIVDDKPGPLRRHGWTIIVVVSLVTLVFFALLPSIRIRLTISNQTGQDLIVTIINPAKPSARLHEIVRSSDATVTIYTGEDTSRFLDMKFLLIAAYRSGTIVDQRVLTGKQILDLETWVVRKAASASTTSVAPQE